MGSSSKSESDSNQLGNFAQKVWGPSAQAYGQLMSHGSQAWPTAMNAVNGAFNQAQGITPQMHNIFNQAFPSWMGQLKGGHMGTVTGQTNPDLFNSLRQSLTGPSNTQQVYNTAMRGNPFTGAAVTGVNNQLAENLYRYGLPKTDDAAIEAGQVGSSRHGIATGLVTSDTLNKMADINSQMLNNNFYKDLNMQLGIANQADSNKLALQNRLLDDNAGVNQTIVNALQNGGSALQNLGMGSMSPYMAAGGFPVNLFGGMSKGYGAPVVLGSGGFTGDSDSSSKGLGIG